MRTLIQFVLTGILAMSAAFPARASAPAAALEVAERYVSAIQSGDTASIGQLIAGNLRARMAGLLSNPDYSYQLVNDNATKTLTLLDSRQGDGGLVEVDYVFSDGEERILKRLYLQPGRRANATYQVVEEQVIP